MAEAFEELSVLGGLEAALSQAGHLGPQHAAHVAAARALARKIDAWDVIVDWALEDARDDGSRPKVPANDNVSIASFLKYLDALGLSVEKAAPGKRVGVVKPVDQLAAMRAQLSAG